MWSLVLIVFHSKNDDGLDDGDGNGPDDDWTYVLPVNWTSFFYPSFCPFISNAIQNN